MYGRNILQVFTERCESFEASLVLKIPIFEASGPKFTENQQSNP